MVPGGSLGRADGDGDPPLCLRQLKFLQRWRDAAATKHEPNIVCAGFRTLVFLGSAVPPRGRIAERRSFTSPEGGLLGYSQAVPDDVRRWMWRRSNEKGRQLRRPYFDSML
jgi:hypothetical protein